MREGTHQGRRHGRALRTGAVVVAGVLALAMARFRSDDRRAASAGGDAAWAPTGAPTPGSAASGADLAATAGAIATRLAERPADVPASRWTRVRRLYGDSSVAPLWLAADGLDAGRSDALLRALRDAAGDAIRLDAYPLDALAAAVEAVRATRRPSAEQLAAADVLLTTVYVSLAEALWSGQVDPAAAGQDWHVHRDPMPTDSVLAQALRDARLDDALARLRPHDAGYEALRRALARYRELDARGGWVTVPAGRKLKPGQQDAPARLAALRERLRAEGFADAGAAPADSTRYDRGLAGLVAEFQARHGIVVDSVLGEETVRSMNVPAARRAAQLAANLERLRWMPRTLGDRYILVNVPAFHLEAFEDGRPTLDMKVIVGKGGDDRTTPVFSDTMTTVVFRPYWNITPDIQRAETAPRIAADPGYMAANDLEYYRDGGETRIRQRPGPRNSLGLVKFLFPNGYNVYLHDTPDDALFAKDVRAFSHGCIRLERPDALAAWVLGWDPMRVDEAMQVGPDDRTVALTRKIPVYLVYQTAYERDGVLHFASDPYGRDAALVDAVAPALASSADQVRRIDALRQRLTD